MHPSLDPYVEDQAVQFIAGDLSAGDERAFRLLMKCDEAVYQYASALAEVTAPLTIGDCPPLPLHLKERVMAVTEGSPQLPEECLVMSNPEGQVRWVSRSFSEMCGYDLDELVGKKIGPLLQGEKTDRETARRLSHAVSQASPCTEIILNYHKCGRPYWVEVELVPIVDDGGQKICLIAQETERKDLPVP